MSFFSNLEALITPELIVTEISSPSALRSDLSLKTSPNLRCLHLPSKSVNRIFGTSSSLLGNICC
ncbi:hypothetical protein NT07LI_0959, partial [Listeria innocua FSL S4-378]